MLSARELANAYDLYLAAIWRGDRATNTFGNWLEARWCRVNLTEPTSNHKAVSLLAAGGSGIRWYEHDRWLLGFVSSRTDGCYIVDQDDEPPQPAAEIIGLSERCFDGESAL